MSADKQKLVINAHKAQCDCRSVVNAALLPHNTELSCNFIDADPCLVLTVKIHEKIRGKPMLVTATYCPFCGKKYLDREARSKSAS